MRVPFTQLYLHCLWATWDREPLVTAQIEQPVYAFILAKTQELASLTNSHRRDG